MEMVQNVMDGFIDFKGQRLAETLTTYILIVVGVLAWVTGYILQDASYTVYIGLGGSALATALVVPPWPFYNRHGLRWLPAGFVAEGEEGKKGQ